MRRCCTVLLVLLVGSLAGCAPLRPTASWPELVQRIKLRQPVVLTDVQGVEVRGVVSSIAPTSMTLDVNGQPRAFDSNDVRQVRRNGDPIWNGLAIGAAVGVVNAMLSDKRCIGSPPVCDAQVPERLVFLGLATAAGIGIDLLHRDQTVLYRSSDQLALRLRPAVTARGPGVSLVLEWRPHDRASHD